MVLGRLAQHLGTTPWCLQLELSSLVNVGILERRQAGARAYFKPQLSSSMVRGLRAVFEIAEGIKNLHRPDVATCIRPNRNQHGPRRPPGVRAEKRGTRVKRGQALQVMCNPRPVAKAVIIQASGKAKLSLSSFMIRRP